jgi:ABC-2 type transport system ATP-binding protein
VIETVSIGASREAETSARDGEGSPVVRVEALGKSFPVRRPVHRMVMAPRSRERTRVLDNVSVTVRAGEFLGLLGPNGAGKTTLLKILATLVLPDEGSASVAGHDVRRAGAGVRDAVSICLANERSLFCV